MVSVPAFSQTAAADEAESDYTDIIVTANKREQRLQDTPTSIGVRTSSRAKKAGVNNYIIKPFSAAVLKAQLKAVLGEF